MKKYLLTSFNVSSCLSIVHPFWNKWICFKINKRRPINTYVHDIIKCVLAQSASKRRFFMIHTGKTFHKPAVLGLTVIIISSNVIVPLISSACRHEILVNVSTKGFLCSFEILPLKSDQCFIANYFSSVVVMLCKQ